MRDGNYLELIFRTAKNCAALFYSHEGYANAIPFRSQGLFCASDMHVINSSKSYCFTFCYTDSFLVWYNLDASPLLHDFKLQDQERIFLGLASTNWLSSFSSMILG